VIVVDTSAWIDHLRDRGELPHVQALRSLFGREPIIVGDLVMAELLQGASDEATASKLERLLRSFELRAMTSMTLAVQSARNYRTLRRLGVTVRKTMDMLIGTFCIESGFSLLHSDRDFEPMEQHLGLANALRPRLT
jgi:predicted nucleic acid-binding protein